MQVSTVAMQYRLLPILLAWAAAGSALAQTRPDAGQTMQDLQRADPARQAVPTPLPSLSVTPGISATAAPDGARVPAVKQFRITGAASLPAAELEALLEPWRGRELTVGELKQAADRITTYYREHGYLVARAYLPVQTIRDNVIEIAVLEGKLGGIVLKNSSRLSDDRAQAVVARIQPGESIQGPALERGLLLLQDLPGAGPVAAALQPGQAVGSSDLVVTVGEAPLVSGAVDADNHGNRYTGAYRAGATLNLNSPAGLGDQLSARVQASNEKLYYGRLAYRIPVGSDGWMLGAAWSASRYRLGHQFEPLGAHGRASVASVFATYPWIRSRSFNLVGSLGFDSKSLRDDIDIVSARTRKSSHQVRAGLAGSGQWGEATYSIATGLTMGKLDIRSPEARLVDDATARSHGHFSKLAYSLGGSLPLARSWSLLALMNGQFASRNLDSSEKFSLGGADGVRAYPQGEAIGDEGYLVTAELRHALPSGLPGAMTVGGFVDYGMVKLNRNPFMDGDNERKLSAIGLSFNWALPGDFLVRASLARKLGHEKATSDSDRTWRFWLQGVRSF